MLEKYRKENKPMIDKLQKDCIELDEIFNHKPEHKKKETIEKVIDSLISVSALINEYKKQRDEGDILDNRTHSTLIQLRERFKYLLIGFINRKIYEIEKIKIEKIKEIINEIPEKPREEYIFKVLNNDLIKLKEKTNSLLKIIQKNENYYKTAKYIGNLSNPYNIYNYYPAIKNSLQIDKLYEKIRNKLNSLTNIEDELFKFIDKAEKQNKEIIEKTGYTFNDEDEN